MALYDIKPPNSGSVSQLPKPWTGIPVHWNIKVGEPYEKPLKDNQGKTHKIPSRFINRGHAVTYFDGGTYLSPKAFASPAILASTIYHERVHVEQYTTKGKGDVLTDNQREAEAYAAEIDNQQTFGTSDAHVNELRRRKIDYEMGIVRAPLRSSPYSPKELLELGQTPPPKEELRAIRTAAENLYRRTVWERIEREDNEKIAGREHRETEECLRDFRRAMTLYDETARELGRPPEIPTEGLSCKDEVDLIIRQIKQMKREKHAAWLHCTEEVAAFERKYDGLQKFWGECDVILGKWRDYDREFKKLIKGQEGLRKERWLDAVDGFARNCGFRRSGSDSWHFLDARTNKLIVIRHSGEGTTADSESLEAGFLIARTCLQPHNWWACNGGMKILARRWDEQQGVLEGLVHLAHQRVDAFAARVALGNQLEHRPVMLAEGGGKHWFYGSGQLQVVILERPHVGPVQPFIELLGAGVGLRESHHPDDQQQSQHSVHHRLTSRLRLHGDSIRENRKVAKKPLLQTRSFRE